MDHLSPAVRDQLLGDTLEMWRCPECGKTAFTHKADGALMVRCPTDHGTGELNGVPYRRLIWMQRVAPTEDIA